MALLKRMKAPQVSRFTQHACVVLSYALLCDAGSRKSFEQRLELNLRLAIAGGANNFTHDEARLHLYNLLGLRGLRSVIEYPISRNRES